jgi:hypothetical protein
MNTAADKMLRAAGLMNDTGDGSIADAGTVFNPVGGAGASALGKYGAQIAGVAGAGLGGYGAGYGIGQATGSGTLGAIGGAITGAKLGAAFGPPGMVVGALAGFAGGIIGAGDAAREAAAKLEAARKSFKNSWDSIVAEINGDDLAQAIAGAGQKFQSLRQQFADTLSFSDFWNGKFKQGLEDINALEQQYVAKLKEEAAAKAHYFDESLDVRILRAQGKTKEADALELRNQQEQERDEFRRTHNITDDPSTTADDAEVAANIAEYNKLLYAQSLELQANTKALIENTRVLNQPTGFKVEAYTYRFGEAQQRPGYSAPPMPTPPQIPLAGGTTLSRNGAPITIAPVFHIDGTKTTRDQVRQIAVELKKVVTETLGSTAADADVSQGWGLLA